MIIDKCINRSSYLSRFSYLNRFYIKNQFPDFLKKFLTRSPVNTGQNRRPKAGLGALSVEIPALAEFNFL